MQIIADNIQITDPVVAKALNEMDPVPIQDLAKRCEDAGADLLDINPGPLTRDGEKKMTFMVEAVQEVSDLPLALDTSNPSAMAAGIQACGKKPIINGFSLEPAKIDKILPLAATFQCNITGFLLHPNGMVPANAEERLTLAVQLFQALSEKGIESGEADYRSGAGAPDVGGRTSTGHGAPECHSDAAGTPGLSGKDRRRALQPDKRQRSERKETPVGSSLPAHACVGGAGSGHDEHVSSKHGLRGQGVRHHHPSGDLFLGRGGVVRLSSISATRQPIPNPILSLSFSAFL